MWRGCGRRLQFLCTLWNSSCGWEPDSCLFQSSHRLCRIQIGAALAGACRPLDYLWSVGGGESCRIPVCCPPVSILGDRSGLVTVGSTRDSSLGGDVVCMRCTVGLFRGLGLARTSLMGTSCCNRVGCLRSYSSTIRHDTRHIYAGGAVVRRCSHKLRAHGPAIELPRYNIFHV